MSDLKDAVCAKLKLDAAPNRVRLLREVEGGGAPVPLDSRMALAGQGVLDGTSLTIEVKHMAGAYGGAAGRPGLGGGGELSRPETRGRRRRGRL